MPSQPRGAGSYLRRLRLIAAVAVAVIVVDHIAKVIATLDGSIVKNPNSEFMFYLPLAHALIAAAIPSTIVRIGAAVAVGGAVSNIIDSLAWPGGIPDFVTAGPEGTWNTADAAIWLGWAVFLVGLLAYALQASGRRAYRRHGRSSGTS